MGLIGAMGSDTTHEPHMTTNSATCKADGRGYSKSGFIKTCTLNFESLGEKWDGLTKVATHPLTHHCRFESINFKSQYNKAKKTSTARNEKEKSEGVSFMSLGEQVSSRW